MRCTIYPLSSIYQLLSTLYALHSMLYNLPSKHYLLLSALYAVRSTAFFFSRTLRKFCTCRSTYKLRSSFKKLKLVQLHRVRLCLHTISTNEILGLFCLKTQFMHVESGLEILSVVEQILTTGRQWATHVFFSQPFNLKGKQPYL